MKAVQNAKRFTLTLATLAAASFVTAGCSSTSEEETGEEIVENEDLDENEGDQAAQAPVNETQNMGQNTEVTDETMGDQMGNPMANQAPIENMPPMENAPPVENLPPMQDTAGMQAAPPADPMMNAGTGAAMDPAAQGMAPPAAPPSSGGMVMFASADGTALYDTPAASGRTVGSLNRGDHMLVFREGEWLRTFDGRYVMGSAMSEMAVPRTRVKNQWR